MEHTTEKDSLELLRAVQKSHGQELPATFQLVIAKRQNNSDKKKISKIGTVKKYNTTFYTLSGFYKSIARTTTPFKNDDDTTGQ